MYVGRDGQPIGRDEALRAFEDPDARTVGKDDVNGHVVSTVWLVIDHSFGGVPGVPVPFETMIFAKHEGECPLDQYQERYATEEAALAGHDRAVATARDAACGLDSGVGSDAR